MKRASTAAALLVAGLVASLPVAASATANAASTNVAVATASASSAHKTTTSTDKLTLSVGESASLRLTECPGCGYSWKIINKASSRLVRTETRYINPPGPGVGGAGKREFTFTALKAGSTKAKLGYFGPGKSHPDRIVTVKLHLQRAS